MLKNNHVDSKKLISELEQLLDDMHRYSTTVDRYVITSSTDIHGKITSVSQAFCQLTGYSEKELIGNKHNILRHPDTPTEFFAEMWQTITSGQSWRGELRNINKSGECFWVQLQIDSIRDEKGNTVGYISIEQNITDRKYIELLTIRDELTGAFNRRHYNHVLPIEIERAKRDNKQLCFMMIDADNFKKYNDTYGHQEGDEVLKNIVATLKNTFKRADDFIFRLGGEEFAVLYRAENESYAQSIADISRSKIYDLNMPHSGNPPYGRVTVSSGVMILKPDQQYILEEIYKYADEALYKAKHNGRNFVSFHDTEDDIELF
ncbi:sensor domain-containing diguanylate cyclase [Thiomicrorhabdus sediminis]|uniref:diguanylate cyclase n=1 Tax=Thiomicrorhabdus sediminis TaxID=2580412 RepID=A0A4P9K5P2_9GAMM|nr:GGDEF domain-containing protein [Thiomicrorhabdus sediminis]QCU90299.1 diguanylate cyclase [Thiomicrorhabdus sediminis]